MSAKAAEPCGFDSHPVYLMKFSDKLREFGINPSDLPSSIQNQPVSALPYTCRKCGSKADIHRHHMGCERMWLEHFKAHGRTKLYKAYKKRYESFNETDIVRICASCHNIIHVIYLQQINRMIAEAGYRKLSEWSWEEARGMMKVLRKVCKLWLEGKL